jgi:hypothetical protein
VILDGVVEMGVLPVASTTTVEAEEADVQTSGIVLGTNVSACI